MVYYYLNLWTAKKSYFDSVTELRVKRGDYVHIFHQYQKLILLEKSSELDWVFCRISYTLKNIRGIIYYFLILII